MLDKVEGAFQPAEYQRSGITRSLLNTVGDWLTEQALKDGDVENIVYGCCERLQAIGIPLIRGYFVFPVLHPLHSAIGITWERGSGSKAADYPHVPGGISDSFKKSPHYYMIERDLAFMRIWMDSAHRQYSFPVLPDLRAKGVTDYLAFVVNLGRETAFRSGGRSGMLGSWATDDPAGFSEADIDSLLKIQDRLAVACKMAIKSQLMRNIAKTYLGRSAGKRVLSGQIKRGDGQSIKAAIWYADLRNSTAMADTLPRQDYIDTLNAYFDTTGGAVVEAGGEILSFIGDAVLAIFPTDGRPDSVTEACERALAAAAGSRQRMHVLNDKRAAAGKAGLDFGVGLHLGEVMYGNVGVPARLTFSVFGAAVNEVARLDQLTKSLGEPVLVTGEFAAAIEQPWRAAGAHALKGVGRKLKVFAPGWSALPAARKESATMMA